MKLETRVANITNSIHVNHVPGLILKMAIFCNKMSPLTSKITNNVRLNWLTIWLSFLTTLAKIAKVNGHKQKTANCPSSEGSDLIKLNSCTLPKCFDSNKKLKQKNDRQIAKKLWFNQLRLSSNSLKGIASAKGTLVSIILKRVRPIFMMSCELSVACLTNLLFTLMPLVD